MSKSLTLSNFFAYTVFLFVGLNIKIFAGFYIYNVLILLFIFQQSSLRLSKVYLVMLCVFSFGIALSATIQIFYIDSFNVSGIYVLANLLILTTFFIYMQSINLSGLNFNIIILLVSLPILLSILMFHNGSIEQHLLSIYNVEKYPAFGRYGGVFGADVNALGIYASLVLIFSMIIKKYNRISSILSIFITVISLYAVVLSGMRVALLVFFGLLFLMNSKLKIINYRYMVYFVLAVLMIIAYIYNSNESAREIIDYLLDRFSIDRLINDFTSEDRMGNFELMMNSYYRIIEDIDMNFIKLLFGVDSSLTFVDNFYLFLFLKHGLLMVVLFIMSIIFLSIRLFIDKNIIGLYFLAATTLIAIKGLFIINNFYMFIVLMAMFSWKNFENSHH